MATITRPLIIGSTLSFLGVFGLHMAVHTAVMRTPDEHLFTDVLLSLRGALIFAAGYVVAHFLLVSLRARPGRHRLAVGLAMALMVILMAEVFLQLVGTWQLSSPLIPTYALERIRTPLYAQMLVLLFLFFRAVHHRRQGRAVQAVACGLWAFALYLLVDAISALYVHFAWA